MNIVPIIRIIDLCSGGGVIAEAFEDSIGLDNNRKALEYYQNDKVLGDATKTPFRSKATFFSHGSPPCQRFSTASHGNQKNHIDIVTQVRNELMRISEHYSIENVPQAPIRKDLILCATVFNLPGRRHRKFELTFDVPWMKCGFHNIMRRPTAVNARDRSGMRIRSYFANKKGNAKRNQQLLGCRELPAFVSGEGVPPDYMRYILKYVGKTKISLEDFGF